MDERIFTLWVAYVGTPVVVLLHAVWLRLRQHPAEQSEKTPYQKCTEATVLMEVERERAARRKTEGAVKAGQASGVARRGDTDVSAEEETATNDREMFRSRSETNGRASQKVGEILGVSDRTAEKMAVIGETAKEAEATGDTEHAKLAHSLRARFAG